MKKVVFVKRTWIAPDIMCIDVYYIIQCGAWVFMPVFSEN